MNYCYNRNNSCSACCGFSNLKLSHEQKKAWALENTEAFLSLDITNAKNLVAFRKEGEEYLLNKRYRDDIYVCPFVGLVDEDKSKTGCLLHPQGSPHPDIGVWPHPQNFSFYGESICLAYDCPSKESKSLDSLRDLVIPEHLYALIASNRNLILAFEKLTSSDKCDKEKLWMAILAYLESESIPVTSFEIHFKELEESSEPWYELGSLLDKNAYVYDTITMTELGRRIGESLQKRSKK